MESKVHQFHRTVSHKRPYETANFRRTSATSFCDGVQRACSEDPGARPAGQSEERGSDLRRAAVRRGGRLAGDTHHQEGRGRRCTARPFRRLTVQGKEKGSKVIHTTVVLVHCNPNYFNLLFAIVFLIVE
ncbi:hypothetical protein GBAR_LOCUS2081 [Geodia barretti]|uniref:Uncharacterized protein n=1 Tax=Geodia barretti TaxID=519541 RepID=A0AA35R013_GEOBA|nr:hypothetical protein GBAR_LOCUS2081 [Geodia barretti]